MQVSSPLRTVRKLVFFSCSRTPPPVICSGLLKNYPDHGIQKTCLQIWWLIRGAALDNRVMNRYIANCVKFDQSFTRVPITRWTVKMTRLKLPGPKAQSSNSHFTAHQFLSQNFFCQKQSLLLSVFTSRTSIQSYALFFMFKMNLSFLLLIFRVEFSRCDTDVDATEIQPF